METNESTSGNETLESKDKQSSKGVIMDILSGNLFTMDIFLRQLPFIFFLVFIAFLQIANSYHAEKIKWQIRRAKEEIKGLRAQSLTVASEYMFLSNQTEVVRMVNQKGIDLKESVDPPKKIEILKIDRKIKDEKTDNFKRK